MKLFKWGFIAVLMSSSAAHAINPMPGWYAGFNLGASQAPASHYILVNPLNDQVAGTGTLYYSRLGSVGGQLGYRVDHLRAEGEVFYNNNFYRNMRIEGVNIPNDHADSTNPLQLNGYTNTYAFMLNGYYDFFARDYTTKLVPYVGLGVGYAHFENNIQFLYEGTVIAGSVHNELTNSAAGQGIVGLSYYLTDYTAFSLDFRYFASLQGSNVVGTEVNKFDNRPELYSVNFTFNSSFNLG